MFQIYKPVFKKPNILFNFIEKYAIYYKINAFIMRMNENKLDNIINKSVNKALNEAMLKSYIKKLVKESVETMGDFSQYEAKGDKEDGRLSDMNTETNAESETRDSIENFFKQPGVNNAPYAYELYGVEAKEGQDTNDMKNARKKFADCVNHEKNQNGYPYSFNSSELNRLKGMISGNELSEAVNNAIKKVLSENNHKTTRKRNSRR
jgi:hypothetical protein